MLNSSASSPSPLPSPTWLQVTLLVIFLSLTMLLFAYICYPPCGLHVRTTSTFYFRLLSCFYWITWMLSVPPESIPIFHTGNHLMESENVSYTCQCFWNKNKWNGTHLFKVADGQVSSFVVSTFQWCTFWKFLQHSICCCMHHCVNDFNKSWTPILNSLLKFCAIFFLDQPYTK